MSTIVVLYNKTRLSCSSVTRTIYFNVIKKDAQKTQETDKYWGSENHGLIHHSPALIVLHYIPLSPPWTIYYDNPRQTC